MPNVEHRAVVASKTSEFAICVNFQRRFVYWKQTNSSLFAKTMEFNPESTVPTSAATNSANSWNPNIFSMYSTVLIKCTRSLRNGPIASNHNFSFHCSHFVLPRRNPNIYTSRLRLNASSSSTNLNSTSRYSALPPRSLLVHLFLFFNVLGS